MPRNKYYDQNGFVNEQAFKNELEKIDKQIEEGLDIEGLKKIKRKLYYLKARYEECGERNLGIETRIQCVNEFLYD